MVALADDVDSELLKFDRVLFLDFDGVMHPESGDPSMHFCFALNFHDVLQTLAPALDTPIVISSTWRLTSTLPEMRQHFAPTMRHQIIGVTPDLDTIWEPAICHNRQSEIEAWMAQFAPEGQWLAIDDRSSLFNPDCANLFCVPDYRPGLGAGLNLHVCEDLKVKLQAFFTPSAPCL